MKKIIFFSSLLTLLLSACSKSDNCKITMAGIAGSYKLTSAKYKASSSSPEVDYLPVLAPEECERDNTIVLNANGTTSTIDSGIECDPPSDEEFGTTWSLDGDYLEFEDLDEGPYKIESFNCKQLVLSNTAGFVAGDQIIFTFTKL